MMNPGSTIPSGLTDAQLAQLGTLNECPDTADIPEAPVENWRDARRFSKPRREAVSLCPEIDSEPPG